MSNYKTSEIARGMGIHPNTVRLYETLGFISRPERRANGYRVFTERHIEQIQFARTALRVEVLQNGLRKQAIEIIKISASGNLDEAAERTGRYLQRIRQEQRNAEEAIAIVRGLLSGTGPEEDSETLTRKQTADALQIPMDALRNWEMNGLLEIKRRRNGYRVYTGEDLRQLKIIRSLRCANYSLASILRMLNAVSAAPEADIRQVIDTPGEADDIISVCDKLLTSLGHAEKNAIEMLSQLEKMKEQFGENPPL